MTTGPPWKVGKTVGVGATARAKERIELLGGHKRERERLANVYRKRVQR